MRFRNTFPYTATVTEAGVTVGPGGEFDWPDYDPEIHGVVAGMEPLDKAAKKRKTADSQGGDKTTAGDPPADNGGTAASDTTKAPAAPASEENKS
jgi:hypothetical protein